MAQEISSLRDQVWWSYSLSGPCLNRVAVEFIVLGGQLLAFFPKS